MTTTPPLCVYVDPPSPHYLGDRLFDAADPRLNRDGGLLPYVRMKEALGRSGIAVHTVDRLLDGRAAGAVNHYWSMGPLDRYPALAARADVVLKGFLLFEPPLVAPDMYRALPDLTRHFDRVFVHNVVGDGYSSAGVDTARLRKLHWPQPYDDVVAVHWQQRERQNRIAVVAGPHNPGRRKPELYSERIEAVAALEPFGCVDLYGRGWDRWWSRSSMWPAYWRHRRALMRAYRGPCESKLATLAAYRFALCLENMPMQGYVTEKIFDCFYAGTVPIYKGGSRPGDDLPAGAFIDARAYESWSDLWRSIEAMPRPEWERYRECARRFVRGREGMKYFASLETLFGEASGVPRSPEKASEP
jgi:hypothetical protein